jgi:RimJ/RimL family protein N-acetyltransferase
MSILSVACEEPKGTVIRSVNILPITIENLKRFYDVASKFTILFGKPLTGIDDFISRFVYFDKEGTPDLYGPIWVIDDFVGVFTLTDMTPSDAIAHFTFLDRRFKGRLNLTKEMIKYVFETYGFNRLTVQVPLYVGNTTVKFVNELGFGYEGKKRKAALYKGNWFDVRCYGILKEEVLNVVRES